MNRNSYNDVLREEPADDARVVGWTLKNESIFPLYKGAGGIHIPVIGRTEFSFAGRANSGQDLPLVKALRSGDWSSAVLSVRLHSKGTWSSTAQLFVGAQNVVFPEDDPSTTFSTQSLKGYATIQQSDAAPLLLTIALDEAPIGSFTRIMLRWEQGATVSDSPQTASISVDVIARCDDINS